MLKVIIVLVTASLTASFNFLGEYYDNDEHYVVLEMYRKIFEFSVTVIF